jgi:hypothetical protein
MLWKTWMEWLVDEFVIPTTIMSLVKLPISLSTLCQRKKGIVLVGGDGVHAV